MNIYSKLKYLPLQNLAKRKLPDVLIYQKQHKLSHDIDINVDDFFAFSLKKPFEHAQMKCIKTDITRDNIEHVPSLYVWILKSSSSGLGLGSSLLNFAKIYSKKIGCNGFIHLTAETSYSPNRVPHIFYRKFGMSTLNSNVDKRLDNFIRLGKYATSHDFETTDMFFPPIKHERKNIFVKLLDKLKKL